MSPIYTRPIREQLEHDRVIRQLQARYKRKHEVAINPGNELNQSVMAGELAVYPDLVLFNPERNHLLEGTVEVETGESVHLLEARAEWGTFSRLKAPFYLYVPPQAVETAKRICEEQQFEVAEIWTYHMALDQARFTQVYKSPHPVKPATVSARPAAKAKAVAPAKPAATAAKPAATAAKTAAPAAKPAASAAKPAAKSAKAAARPAVKPAAKPAKKSVAKSVKPTKPVAKPVKAKPKAAAKAKKAAPPRKRR